jgi:hypothetical protein
MDTKSNQNSNVDHEFGEGQLEIGFIFRVSIGNCRRNSALDHCQSKELKEELKGNNDSRTQQIDWDPYIKGSHVLCALNANVILDLRPGVLILGLSWLLNLTINGVVIIPIETR